MNIQSISKRTLSSSSLFSMLWATLALLIFVAAGLFYSNIQSTSAQPGTNCTSAFYINETLPNGSSWQMCWEHRNREGIVYYDIYYTPPSGPTRKVLSEASLAQVHVPYDDNGARYHDITDYGFGSSNMNDLTPADCPGGSLLTYSGKDVLCQRIESQGHLFRSGGQQLQGNLLSLFSVSHVGAYNYIPLWQFHDDGTIEASVGATGRLQRRGGSSLYGWPISSSGTIGISHLHNYYWRLDFDIGGTSNNDVVEEFDFVQTNGGLTRTKSVSQINTESKRSVSPSTMRSWRIRDGAINNSDGHPISYEILPLETGHRDEGPSYEPWTFDDFYVTKYKSCEKFASHNPTTNNCAADVSAFVNGESLAGQDLVVWYGTTFHHVPRDEDEPYMHAHWDGFEIRPRDWTADNPLTQNIATATPTSTPVVNNPPTITNPGNQSSPVGSSVTLDISASDPDNDPLTYSATGLPNGLTINTGTGRISGAPSTSGTYNVSTTVSDGQGGTATTNFTWTVTVVNPGSTIQVTARGQVGTEEMELRIDGVAVQSWSNVGTTAQNYSYSHPAGVTADQIRVHFTNDGREPVTNADRNLIVDKISIDGTTYETEAPSVLGEGVWNGSDCRTLAYHQNQMLACRGYFQYSSSGNRAPTVTNPGSQFGSIGNGLSLSIGANDPDGDPLVFGASGLPGGLSLNNSSGVISGVPITVGSYPVTITVDDGNGGTDSTTFNWTITQEPIAGCGPLEQEAEVAQLLGSFVIVNDASASGGQYVHAPIGSGNAFNGPTNNQAEFCFNVSTPGIYRLLGTVLSPSGSSNSFYVTVDGAPVDGHLWDTTIGSSYVADYVSHRGGADPVEVLLSAGDHTITVYLRENGTRLDKLSLELVTATQPPTACGGMSQEAEAGTFSGNFTVGNDANASGGQFAHVPNGAGNNLNGTAGADRAEYCFDVPTAGTYWLQGRVLATGGGSNSFYVTVDGVPANGNLWDTIISATYADDFVSHRGGADPLQLTLSQGEHTVIVYSREDGTLLDKLTLIDANGVAAASQPRESSNLGNSAVFGTLLVPASMQSEPKISGRLVTIVNETNGEIVGETETNYVGKYYIDNLPAGTYQVRVERNLVDDATQVLEQQISVSQGETAEASFALDLE
ncbi:MAG: putative Ig domain-containing protein [Chloroflexota bacterium]